MDKGNRMVETASADLVPFFWPEAWKDPRHLALLEGSPINCLLFRAPAEGIEDAARKAGFTVIRADSLNAATVAGTKWGTSSSIIAINGMLWPRAGAASSGGSNQLQAGPTGLPWIDSNSWAARLATARAPSKQIWLFYEPPKDEAAPGDIAYRIAIADAAAAGVRWPVSLHEATSSALAAGDAGSLKIWRVILDTLSFFEKRKEWRSYLCQGPLGVVSSFAGDNELLSTEFLNLSARRNLLYRIFDRSRLAAAEFGGIRAVVWLDSDPPPPEALTRLTTFARDGGLLIVSQKSAAAFKGERLLDCPVLGYELRSLGKGRIASALREWNDPYLLAADMHSLVGRRFDPLRIFNGSSFWVHYSSVPKGKDRLIQLVSFGNRPRAGGNGTAEISLRIAEPHSSVTFQAIEIQPAPLSAVKENGFIEYHLPEFNTYAALEVKA
jgi:hypothetical protein